MPPRKEYPTFIEDVEHAQQGVEHEYGSRRVAKQLWRDEVRGRSFPYLHAFVMFDVLLASSRINSKCTCGRNSCHRRFESLSESRACTPVLAVDSLADVNSWIAQA